VLTHRNSADEYFLEFCSEPKFHRISHPTHIPNSAEFLKDGAPQERIVAVENLRWKTIKEKQETDQG